MSIPQEVILDLLPAYLAGEVSAATRAWLEERLGQDPALAERVRRQTEILRGASLPPLSPESELRALQRTRRRMAQLRWLFGLATASSATALALEISFHPVKVRLLLLDSPAQLVPCLVFGAVCWVAYFRLRRQLRGAGV